MSRRDISAGAAPPAIARHRAAIALALLLAGYTISFVDRIAISIVQEQLKLELGLRDWHLGLMIGPAFAIVYAVASLPLARFAERRNRPALLAICLGVWSLMTMACGLARNFFELFLARMGVGIGEAGGNPASHSLIADYFPPDRRARAIAIYSLGAPLGSFLGAALVGWLASTVGWRTTFLWLGLPGLLTALLVWRLVPEPPRGTFDETGKSGQAVPPFMHVVRELLGRPDFRHLVWAASLIVLVGYSTAAFIPAYLMRRHGLTLGEVGWMAGAINGIAAGIGTMAGGYAGDRWGGASGQRLPLIPALVSLLAAPLLVAGLLSGSLWIAFAGTFLGTMMLYGYIAPAFALVHRMATARSRATSTAIYYLITNIIGLGIGPPLIGAMSDWWARRTLGLSATAFDATCLPATGTPAPACAGALAEGLTAAMASASLLTLLAAIHFVVAARYLARRVS